MMLKSFIAIVLLCSFMIATSQDAYHISIRLEPIKNQYIYFGYYSDKEFSIKDSAFLNAKSTGVFKGKRKLIDGIYSVAYPGGLFYLTIDKNYKFSVAVNTASIDKAKFTGSPENNVFVNYLNYRIKNNELLKGLRTLYRTAPNAVDSASLAKEINDTLLSMKKYRENIIRRYPKSFLALLLKTGQEPSISQNYPEASWDFFSSRFYPYLQTHYWDGIQFYDTAILDAPGFDDKLDNYFDRFVSINADSVNKKIDWVISYAGANEKTERFFLEYFINRYYNPKQPWEEQVLIHIFEKYFAQKSYSWLGEKDKQQVADWVFRIMANTKGRPAADINLPDTAGIKRTLYNLKAPYTLVIFWNPLCEHCKQVLPQLDSFYNSKWKTMGVQFFAVAMELRDTKEMWESVINELHVNEWTHVYYSKADDEDRITKGLGSYTLLYNVSIFPTLYLLDKDKKITAKNVTPEQIEKILDLINSKPGKL
jgi:thiol-disulfide isomerase/thioredoxin